MVIFGAAGDLTKRLVVPALYNLVRGGKLPKDFAMIGVDRNDESTEAWRQNLTSMIEAFARAGGGEREHGALNAPAWSWLTLTAGSRNCWPSNSAARTAQPTFCSIWQSPTGFLVRSSSSLVAPGSRGSPRKHGGG